MTEHNTQEWTAIDAMDASTRLTSREAAVLIRRNVDTVQRLWRQDKLRGTKSRCNALYFRKSDVDLVRDLGRDLVNSESRDQAGHALRNSKRDRGQVGFGKGRQVS